MPAERIPPTSIDLTSDHTLTRWIERLVADFRRTADWDVPDLLVTDASCFVSSVWTSDCSELTAMNERQSTAADDLNPIYEGVKEPDPDAPWTIWIGRMPDALRDDEELPNYDSFTNPDAAREAHRLLEGGPHGMIRRARGEVD